MREICREAVLSLQTRVVLLTQMPTRLLAEAQENLRAIAIQVMPGERERTSQNKRMNKREHPLDESLHTVCNNPGLAARQLQRDEMNLSSILYYWISNGSRRCSFCFLAEGASIGQTGLSSSRLGENRRARRAEDNGGGVTEDGGPEQRALGHPKRKSRRATMLNLHMKTPRASHIHKETVRALDKSLQLVLALLIGRTRVQQIALKLRATAQHI
jgi:hypothetical protein